MFKIGIKSNATDVSKSLKKLQKRIKDHTVPNGLDKKMKAEAAQFRERLAAALDEIRERTTIVDPVGTLPDQKTSIPKSEKDVLTFLMAKESEFEKDRKPTEKNFYNNVHFVQNLPSKGKNLPHLRITVPAKKTDSLENLYMSAVESFANGVIVYDVGGKNQYFILSQRGRAAILDYAKKVCSRYSGVDSLDKKETRKRRQSEIKKGLNVSTWAIKQEFVDKVVNGQDGYGINITPIIESLKYGNIEQAETTLASVESQAPDRIKPTIEKVRKLKETSATLGDESPYVRAAEFSKTVQLRKDVKENKTTYSLVTKELPDTLENTASVTKQAAGQATPQSSRVPSQPQIMNNQLSWEEVLRKVLGAWLTDKEIDLVIELTKVLIDDIIKEFEKD